MQEEGLVVKTEFKLSREETEAIVRNLEKNWIPLDDQHIIFKVIRRLERELKE
jgi:exonuclease VII small subunit